MDTTTLTFLLGNQQIQQHPLHSQPHHLQNIHNYQHHLLNNHQNAPINQKHQILIITQLIYHLFQHLYLIMMLVYQ